MVRRFILTAAVLAASSALFSSHVLATNPVWSFEDGTAGGFTQSYTASPNYTNRAIASFGATDGNLAYGFDAAVGSYTAGDNVFFNFGPETYVSQADLDRFAAFKASNLIFADITVQGQRAMPDPGASSSYIAFKFAFNGPSQAGGYVDSENNGAVNPITGEIGTAVAGFNLDYYTDARTRTLTWDYVAAGYDFNNLSPSLGSQNYTGLNVAQDGSLPTASRAAFDNIRIYREKATDPTFNGGPTADWNTSFDNGSPNAVDAVAIFKGRPDAAVTVNLSSAKTVGSIILDNVQRNSVGIPLTDPATAYTITGSPLTLQVSGNNASLLEANIVVEATSNTISAPLILASNTVIDITADVTNGRQQGVPNGAAALTVGNVTLASGKTLRTTSAGTLTINGNLIGGSGSALHVNGRKTVLSGTGHRISVGGLSVATSAQLDIGSNIVTVDYAAADPSPIADLTAAIKSGYANGAQTGNGIISSTAAPNMAVGIIEASTVTLAGGLFGGQAVDGTTVLIRTTFKGDSDLNGAVNFDDLLALAQNYNGSGKLWRQGDSNYDGQVNFDDLLALAQNYNLSLSVAQSQLVGRSFASDFALAQSLVPEPTTLATIGVASLLLRRRRH